jgi:hypothetical protein
MGISSVVIMYPAVCNCRQEKLEKLDKLEESEGSRINWSLGLFLRNSLVNVV